SIALESWAFSNERFCENPSTIDCDDSKWDKITIPHSWNNIDGQTGPTYLRTIQWYRVKFDFNNEELESQIILNFESVMSIANIYVNGAHVGEHRGGFSKFRFNITKFASKTTTIAVSVDNRYTQDVAPIDADFTFYGGIFRDVGYFIVPKNVPSISLFDFGSEGVQFRQLNALSKEKLSIGEFEANIKLANSAELDKTATILIEVFSGIDIVKSIESSVIVPLKSSNFAVNILFDLQNPQLWNGRHDPFLYTAKIKILHERYITDSLNVKFGVRSFHVDVNTGFYLNGKPYDLHGVNAHQDWQDLGWTATAEYTRKNFELMNELNITVLRCSHYQHSSYTHQLADEFGIVVWAEIPNINFIYVNPKLYSNTQQQLIELIRQGYNHPSIMFWGIANETIQGDPLELIKILNNLAHSEDPHRLTTMAANNDASEPINKITDLIAFNRYEGWYYEKYSMLGPRLDGYHTENPKQSIALSEYGGGSGINIHSETPKAMDHSEEFAAILHENYWPQIANRPYLWLKTIWVLADFASASRTEGETSGRNDKGLVTYDRVHKKDAFFYYKAQWRPNEPMIYIASRRFVRRAANITVKVYATAVSNIELIVNGEHLGVLPLSDTKVHIWDITLSKGENTVFVRAEENSQISDTVVWIHE
ncbi:hypothetical protein HK096_010746, partial [Nowakowskiella sp. JEL0078]